MLFRSILVDTVGLLLNVVVHPADIQDRDGGVLVLSTLFGMFPFLKILLLMAAIRGRSFKGRWRRFCRSSKPKSSNARTRPRASWFCHAAGLSSAPSHGSTVAAVSPRTGKISPATRSPSCASPPSASCSENSAIPHKLSGLTLTTRWTRDRPE